MDISLVIPLLNEDESLPELTAWIEKVMGENNYTYEIIYVDDGSTDNSWKIIEELRNKNPAIKGIKFQRNYGKSAGLNEAALSGGVWQNQVLLNLVRDGLRQNGFVVYFHQQVPTNDGGLSLGQAVIANYSPGVQDAPKGWAPASTDGIPHGHDEPSDSKVM
jgi:glycosyltransferase involved in cell wall biosynthesis